MMRAQNRLAKRKDIERVIKRGRSFFAQELGIRTVKNNLGLSRFTVVTSIKISKKAVDRNKLKRRLREILRKEIMPKIRQGFDGIVLTKKGLLELSFDELRALCEQLFKKARLI